MSLKLHVTHNCLPSLRPVGFWRAFDSLSTGKALMAVWRSLAGTDFPHLQAFLQLTNEQSSTYPCIRSPWCECDHEVSDDPEWEQVAVCTCGDCEPFPLTRQQTMLHAFNRRTFGEALRGALGFAPPITNAVPPAFGPIEIASYRPLHAPVYFYAPTSPSALSAQVNVLLADHAAPFLLLTPTASFITPPLLQSLTAAGCAHVALSTILAPVQLAAAWASVRHPLSSSGGEGRGEEATSTHGTQTSCHSQLSSLLSAWSAAVASRSGSTVLQDLHRELAAVRHDFAELRTAKQRVEQMQAEGLFAFTNKVDPASFKILCAILSAGDVSKAARTLHIPDSTLRKLLREWQGRGATYAAMLDLIRWRKKIGRKQIIPLNDSILHEKADTTDYPALLSDVLDTLLSMTETNWQDLAEELTSLLRPVLAVSTQTARSPSL